MPAIKTPPWVADAQAARRRLIPLVFVGAWSSGSDADQAILSEIGAGTCEEIEKTIADLLAKIRVRSGQLACSGESFRRWIRFYAVHSFITRHDLEGFLRMARVVLSETDTALDLPEEHRCAANLIEQHATHARVPLRDLGNNLSVTSAHVNDLFGLGKVIGFQHAGDRKRGKRRHHSVEEFGQLGITLQPLESTFTTRQPVSRALAGLDAFQEESDAACPGLAAKEKRSTVQGSRHVALEEFVQRRQGEAAG
jgi:hypothetical protein